jgi:hypothetical protein
VTTALATEPAKMTRRQKLSLADHLLTETGAHAKPDTIRDSEDPALTAELRRRLTDRSPGAWLTLEEFRAQTRPR